MVLARKPAWLPLAAAFLASCGGGGAETVAPPSVPAPVLFLPDGPLLAPGMVAFELSWAAGIEADEASILVELDGQAQPGPVTFSSTMAQGSVESSAIGQHLLRATVALRPEGLGAFVPQTAEVAFETVPSSEPPPVPVEVLWSLPGAEAFGATGTAVACLGDLNGDGLPEAVLASPGSSFGGPKSGLVEIRSGLDGELIRSLTGSDQSGFGQAVRVLPDYDGDGIDDLLIGAPSDSSEFDEGGGVLVVSAATGDVLFAYHGEADSERMGAALALLGDVNGDGTDDFAAGGPKALTPVGLNSGTIRVFSGADGSVLWRRDGPSPIVQFGVSIEGLDDLDDDGVPDLAVGAWGDLDAGPSAGAVYFLSGADGAVLDKVLGYVEDDHFGLSLLAVPDLDEDGRRDLLVGAPEAFSDEGVETGTIRLVSTATGGELALYAGTSSLERLGQSLGYLSDLNGDGVPEWGLGAPFYLNSIGRIYVHDGASGERLGLISGPPTLGLFGVSMAPCGDLDGNGVEEFLVGSTLEFNGGVSTGTVRVFSPSPELLLTAGEPTEDALAQGELWFGDGGFVRALVDPELAGEAYELRFVVPGAYEVLASGKIPPGGLAWPLPTGFASAKELLDSFEPGTGLQVELLGSEAARSNTLTAGSR